MSHVFLSHSRLDRDLATRVVHAMESYGLLVWWDWKINAGEKWRLKIQEQLQTCQTIVVLWTPSSVRSDAVIEVAAAGAKREVLVPLYMQPCELPYGFGEINYITLCSWDGARHDPNLQKAISGIQSRISGVTPLLTPEQRAEIIEDRRLRAYKLYSFKLRSERVTVLVGEEKDDIGISRARENSDLLSADNTEYLLKVLDSTMASKSLSELLNDQNSVAPGNPVSSLQELCQAMVDRAVPSFRDQYNVG